MSTGSVAAAVADMAVQTKTIAVVLVANPEAPAWSGLRQLLASEPDMSVVGETGDLENVHRQVSEHRPDVVVVALNAGRPPPLGLLFNNAHAARYVVMSIDQDAEQKALPDAIRLAVSSELGSRRSC